MPAPIRFARLPVSLPLSDIQAEIIALPNAWKAHLNTAHYQGNWTVLSLRSPGGNPDHVVADSLDGSGWADTPLMGHMPRLRAFLDSLPFPLWAVRLLRLEAGAYIKEHRDLDLSYEQGEIRLHFPLITHPAVEFVIDGQRVPMGPGECWYVNANLPHRVANPGPGDRIHLVIDGPVTTEVKTLVERGMVHRRMPPVELAAGLRNWIPTALVRRDDEWLCRWLDAADVPFTDPFFDETLNICRNRPENRHSFAVLGSVDSMMEWAPALPSVPPSAFIFHVSRCGSTLAAQLLGMDPAHIVLAEVPFIDDLLRAAHRGAALPDLVGALRAAFAFYGQQRNGTETRLWVKTDSWHVFFYPYLRALYPETLFYLLYREPSAVLYSHRKRRGMQSVPGIIEQDIIGGEPPATTDLDAYMAMVLGRYMERFLDIAAVDPLARLVNYSEGILPIVERIARETDTPLTRHDQMTERLRFNAKEPSQVFAEEPGSGLPPAMLAPLAVLYERLERARLSMRDEALG